MISVTYALRVLNLALLALWLPSLALAAEVTVGNTLSQLSAAVVWVIALLSTLSGATALALRLDAELRKNPSTPIPRAYLFATGHMLGSWVAGAAAFFIGEAQNMNDWSELVLVIVASFLGAKFIEWIAEIALKVRPPHHDTESRP